MTIDSITRIITAAPSIRAELWQGVAAATIEQLATVTAERDAARADREDLAVSKGESAAAVVAERDKARAKVAELEAEVRVSDQRLADQHDEWSRRVRELEARPVLTVERLAEAMAMGPGSAEFVVAKLGPVTLPAPAVPPEVHERGWQWRPVDGDTAFAPPFATIRACRHCGCLVAGGPTACGRCVSASTPAPSPAVAPGPVLAGVSEGDIACIAANAHRECIDGSPWMDVARAVVARLGASLVAPVDPEAVARDYHDDGSGPSGVPYWTDMGINSKRAAKDTMRATLIAHGIPVTPEAGK